jgi:hypothetical protein
MPSVQLWRTVQRYLSWAEECVAADWESGRGSNDSDLELVGTCNSVLAEVA